MAEVNRTNSAAAEIELLRMELRAVRESMTRMLDALDARLAAAAPMIEATRYQRISAIAADREQTLLYLEGKT